MFIFLHKIGIIKILHKSECLDFAAEMPVGLKKTNINTCNRFHAVLLYTRESYL